MLRRIVSSSSRTCPSYSRLSCAPIPVRHLMNIGTWGHYNGGAAKIIKQHVPKHGGQEHKITVAFRHQVTRCSWVSKKHYVRQGSGIKVKRSRTIFADENITCGNPLVSVEVV